MYLLQKQLSELKSYWVCSITKISSNHQIKRKLTQTIPKINYLAAYSFTNANQSNKLIYWQEANSDICINF